MHNDNKKSTAYLVLTGVLASQFVVNESVGYAQGFLTNSEILLNKEGANSNETTNNLDYNAVEKVDLSKELEKDENTETEQKLTYEYIDESSIRAPKEELDSKELAKRLIIPIFSFASVGAATGIINHLVDSKNEQQNKKEDDPIPGPNQENNTIPTQNQENNTIPRTNQENNTIPRTNQENNTIPMQNQEDNTIPRLNQENNTIPRQNQENNTIPRTNQENNTIPGPNQENNTIPRTNQENNTIPRTNQENNTIPRLNKEDDPGNNFLKIIIYTVLTVILLWLFGKFVIAPLAVLKVYSNEGVFWLNLLTKLKVRPKKVEFIINENEIDEEGNLPGFIIEAAQKNLILNGDEVITPNNKFVFGEVHDEKELSLLNLLTKLKVRPKKVEFIINENEIDEKGNLPNFIIDAAQKNLIRPGDEVIIPKSKKNLEAECANNILENYDYKIFLVDPEAIDGNYTGVLKVVSVSGLSKYFIDMDKKKSNTNSLDGLKDFSAKVSNFSIINVFSGTQRIIANNKDKKMLGIRNAIKVIMHPSMGDIINSSWTRNEKKHCDEAIHFLEKEEINNDYIKSRIDATKLYRSILLEAGFGIKKDNRVFEPNKKNSPGGVEIFQMLIYMEKLLKEDKLRAFGLPVYKSLLIDFYYYSILNSYVASKDKEGNKAEWNERVFKKVKELEGNQEPVSKDVLIGKIEELKGFLLEINSEINADELNNEVNEAFQTTTENLFGL